MGFLNTMKSFFLGDSKESVKLIEDLEEQLESIPDSEAVAKYSELVTHLRKKKSDRFERFAEYDSMAEDPILGQAMEMMGDDATQFDVERERTIWVESDDKVFEDFINEFLQNNVEPYIDTIAYHIIKYGEFGIS